MPNLRPHRYCARSHEIDVPDVPVTKQPALVAWLDTTCATPLTVSAHIVAGVAPGSIASTWATSLALSHAHVQVPPWGVELSSKKVGTSTRKPSARTVVYATWTGTVAGGAAASAGVRLLARTSEPSIQATQSAPIAT